MFLKRLKLRTKLPLGFAGVTFFSLAILIVFLRLNVVSLVEKEATDKAQEIANKNANKVKANIEVAIDATRTMAQMLEGMKIHDHASRDEVNAILKNILEKNPGFLGTWTCFEPDAFDQKDAEYANKPGHDQTGRFIPYWARDAEGKITIEPLLDYDKPGPGDYYLLALKSGEEQILEPYMYNVAGRNILITSLVVPVKVAGETIGVAGIDMALDSLVEVVSKIKIFETGFASIISNNGLYVAHPRDANKIGKPVKDSEAWIEPYLKNIKAGETFTLRNYSKTINDMVNRICVPIHIGLTKTPWALFVNIPETKVLEKPNAILFNSVLVGLISLLIATIIGFIISKIILKPILLITEGAQRFSIGDFLLDGMDEKEIKKTDNRYDELGDIGKAFAKLIAYLKTKTAIAETIANGDLSLKITPASEQDLLGKALKAMADNLNDLISEINQAASQVASGSNQVSDSSQSLSQGSTEQAASLQEITSSMTEIGSQTKLNAENASQASQISTTARSAAENGNEQMTAVTKAMQEISVSSQKIANIIKAIDDIAFQTNLLALNAAVEAARAGKHGKGFAVVAQEVRNLAGRSAKAAQETAELIEGSVKKVEQGSKLVKETSIAFQQIVESVTKTTDLVAEIAAASNEQAQGISQINQGLGQVEDVTQQNTANAEETASASLELQRMADLLKGLVAKFKLTEEFYPDQIKWDEN